jgi:ABC-type multidrug transport system fused ATPase/permease subunit
MIGVIKDLLNVMTPEQRKKSYVLQVLVILTAIFEVVGVTLIGPFMALVGNMGLVESHNFVRYFYELSGLDSPLEFLFFLGVLVLTVLLMAALISILTIWKLSRFAADTGAEFGDSLYEYYLTKDYLYHVNTNSSHLIKQIATEVSRITDHVLQPLAQINARIAAVILISVAIFIYDPLISLAGLLMFFVFYYILFVVVRSRLARNGTAITQVSKKRFSLMNEGFSAIKEIKVLGREKSFIDSFKESGEVFSDAYGSSNGMYNTPRYIMEFVIYSGMIGLVLLLLIAYDGDLSQILPVMAVFGIAAIKLLPSFQQIYSGAAQIKSNASAFYSVRDDLQQARINKMNSSEKTKQVNILSGDINLKNIDFIYPGKNNVALRSISLDISAKSVIGIVGPSGSGKSTLLDLMLGLLKQDQGSMSVNGVDINDSNIRYWQDNIGYVPQSIFLKDGDITENIAFGLDRDDIDMKSINDVIALSQLSDLISSLPEGLNTAVGERGVQLSGGQRQRIGIARALYGDKDFLFFDEATSALDGVTENLIMKAIDKIGTHKTVVMIAHRINTLRVCDYILFVKDGHIVDQGSYEDLLSNNKDFQRMASGGEE